MRSSGRAGGFWPRLGATCLVLLGVALETRSARGQASPAAQASIAHFALANGLDVVLEEDHRQPRVAVLVSYDIGWKDDPQSLPGLSHLVEHLTFRGSRHLSRAYEGMDVLQRAGGDELQGTTHPDFTSYEVVVPSSALALALFVESERMAFSLEKFSASSLQLERDIVGREIRLRFGSSSSAFAQHSWNAFFGEQHPYFEETPGRTSLASVQLWQAQAFFQQGYRPDNAQLVLVGDFELSAARALVEQYFGPIVAPATPRRRRPPPAPSKPARSVVFRATPAFEQLSVTWRAPDWDSDEGIASLYFARLLGRNLRRALLDDAFVVTRVQSGLSRYDLATLFGVRLTVREHIEITSELFARELKQIWRTDWSKELPKLRRELGLRELLTRESLSRMAYEHLLSLRAQRRPYDSERRLQRLARVTPAQMSALSRWFRGEEAMVSWLLKVGANPDERAASGLTIEAR